MSTQAAYNYLTWAFEDDGERPLVLISAQGNDWNTLVALGKRKGYEFTPQEIQSAFALANSWSFYAADYFGFAMLDSNTNQGVMQGQINADGQVLSNAERAALAASPAAIGGDTNFRLSPGDPGSDAPNAAANFKNSDWTVSATSQGVLAFRKNGVAKMFIRSDGKVWASGPGGFLQAKGPAPDDSGGDLRILFPPKPGRAAFNGWIVSITQNGNLAFRKDGQTKMFINRNGAFWGAGAGGFLKKQEAAPSYSPQSVDMGSVLAGGAFQMGATAYTAAANWTVDAANAVASFGADAAKKTVDALTGVGEKIGKVFDPTGW